MADLRSCIKAGVALTAAASFAGIATANDISTPENIGNALPLVVVGDNCGAGNDDVLVCELADPDAGVGEDYWYQWTSPVSGDVQFDVCDSAFDTVLSIIDFNTLSQIVCNDDTCGTSGFRSRVTANLASNQVVIIGIDSWGYTPCGAFTLSIGLPPECEEFGVCPMGTADEGEPCGDNTNGGCNTDPPNFGAQIVRGDSVCGEIWADGGTRDTDWFRYSHPGGSMEYSISSQVPAVLLLVAGGNFDTNPCVIGTTAAAFITTGGACGTATLSIPDLYCAEYVLFVGPDGFEGFPCSGANSYVITLDGEGDCCPWDFNGSGTVDFTDLLELLANWGTCD